MEFIIHRVNRVKDLNNIPNIFGTEIDIRCKGSQLILNHEPYKNGDKLENYLENYEHKTLVLNIKESGIENDVLKLVKKKSIKSYFLLDVEMPYMYSAANAGEKNIAVRYSEYEDISFSKYFMNKLDWIWIDTTTTLPINKKNKKILNNFKSCLVCPERWGRKKDIKVYKSRMKRINFQPTAIMTSKNCIKYWY